MHTVPVLALVPERGLVLEWGLRWYKGHCPVLELGVQFRNWDIRTTQFRNWTSFLVPGPELGQIRPVPELGQATVPVPELGRCQLGAQHIQGMI